jgi:hypothetical protein
MHVSPFSDSAAVSARMWLDTPGPRLARRIEVEALGGPIAAPQPRKPVPVPSFAQRSDNWS